MKEIVSFTNGLELSELEVRRILNNNLNQIVFGTTEIPKETFNHLIDNIVHQICCECRLIMLREVHK